MLTYSQGVWGLFVYLLVLGILT